jgi:hypothetical protein
MDRIKIGFLLFASFCAAADKAVPQMKLKRTETIRVRAKCTFQKDIKESEAVSRKRKAHFAAANLCSRK